MKRDFRDSHPSKKLQPSTRLWRGMEVEGCLKGQPIFFIAEALTKSELLRVYHDVMEEEITGIFLTETFEAWDWLDTTLLLEILADKECTSTVGRMNGEQTQEFFSIIRPRFPTMRVMIRYLDAGWALDLQPEDEISFGVPYNLFTMRVGDGVRSLPKDYENDK